MLNFVLISNPLLNLMEKWRKGAMQENGRDKTEADCERRRQGMEEKERSESGEEGEKEALDWKKGEWDGE